MKKAWKLFWKTLSSIFSTINNIAEAGEKYAESVKKTAEYDAQKADLRHTKKLAKLTSA